MRSSRNVWMVDVGHGNCTVVEHSGSVAIVDGGRSDTLLRFLLGREMRVVDTIYVSHADADHFGGVSAVLANREICVKRVFIAPDCRETDLWLDFVSVMIDAKLRSGTEFVLEMNDTTPGETKLGDIILEVVAPSQEDAIRTSRGLDSCGRRLNPNSSSGVVRILASGSSRVLLAGDIDEIGFDNIAKRGRDIGAEILVFPHHGGRPGRSDPEEFAESLVAAVDPDVVVFSIGRNNRRTPSPRNCFGDTPDQSADSYRLHPVVGPLRICTPFYGVNDSRSVLQRCGIKRLLRRNHCGLTRHSNVILTVVR